MLVPAKPGAPGLLSPTQSVAGGGFTLEAQRQRTKHISGSPRHKSLKKMHFIKNMRQYDTKNSRIVLICAKRTLCVAFSILPYGESLRISDLKMEGQKQRHPSGGVSVSTEMVLGLEGVELGADGKVVSYAKFLYPTNALVVRKADSHCVVPSCRASASRSLPGSRYKPVTGKTIPAGTDIGSEAGDAAEYDPNLLDDPQWPCGKHKRVLIFASYMTTVIEYVKPSDLKKDMNETFREKFPHIKLTLSKIRSLKREMRNLSEECNLEPVTVSMAYVYFEKLVLQGKLNKQNRKLCAGACVLLAAKISSDLRKHEVKHLIDKLEERFRFNRRDLIGFEFTVLVALELALYLPENQRPRCRAADVTAARRKRCPPSRRISASAAVHSFPPPHTRGVTARRRCLSSEMQNDAGEFVDLYVPRKCSASNRIIGAKDHASIQINISEVDKVTGRVNGQFKTYAICGAIRRMGESDDSILRLAKNDGIVSKNF
ncbi:CDK5 and ABL1 enzyme substrate 2 isoform B [Patagioenas fasciata monilis]|uniref:Small ribosomal subunit protein eS21 n=1 Tax=Patagioenas fasciata monilis TaxID=372326 RepID=A0A1V4KKH6_PATFA|nr:CDK5 and ABL1 enzyme substrate 2 isoform B [Patagioenas fasciata monilis]